MGGGALTCVRRTVTEPVNAPPAGSTAGASNLQAPSLGESSNANVPAFVSPVWPLRRLHSLDLLKVLKVTI